MLLHNNYTRLPSFDVFLGENKRNRTRHKSVVSIFINFATSKASDTLSDFIHRSPRSPSIAIFWHVRYRRLNSPAFAKCARSSDFLRSLRRIASKANPSGWAILSHDFSKLPHRRDRRKIAKCVRNQSVAKIACNFRWRSNSSRSADKIARCVAGLM